MTFRTVIVVVLTCVSTMAAFAQTSSAGVAAEGIYGVGIQIGMAEMGAYAGVAPATLAQGLSYAHGLALASGCIPVEEIDRLRDAMQATRDSRSLFPRISEYRQRLADYIRYHCNCSGGAPQPGGQCPNLSGSWRDDRGDLGPLIITQAGCRMSGEVDSQGPSTGARYRHVFNDVLLVGNQVTGTHVDRIDTQYAYPAGRGTCHTDLLVTWTYNPGTGELTFDVAGTSGTCGVGATTTDHRVWRRR